MSINSGVLGCAFVCPVSAQNKKWHMTLTYVKTRDPNVLKKVHELTVNFIKENVKNDSIPRGNLTVMGPNSVLLGDEAEKFKKGLHEKLISNPEVKNYIDYRKAHVDINAGNKNNSINAKTMSLEEIAALPIDNDIFVSRIYTMGGKELENVQDFSNWSKDGEEIETCSLESCPEELRKLSDKIMYLEQELAWLKNRTRENEANFKSFRDFVNRKSFGEFVNRSRR
jgi:hypothetical protein